MELYFSPTTLLNEPLPPAIASVHLQQIDRRVPPMLSVISAWVFSYNFAAYFQNTFSQERVWRTAS